MTSGASTPWDEAVAWLRENHRVSFSGLALQAWECSCGAAGTTYTTRGTHAQARANSDRHLRAQRRRFMAARPDDVTPPNSV